MSILDAPSIALAQKAAPNGVVQASATGGVRLPDLPSIAVLAQTPTPSAPGITENIGSLYGMGTPIGSVAGFNVVTIRAQQGAGAAPTTFRAVLKTTDQNGTVLAETCTASPAGIAALSPVAFYFGAVQNAGGGAVWLEVYADQPFLFSANATPIASPAAVYAVSPASAVSNVWGGAAFNFYTEFSYDLAVTRVQLPLGSPTGSGGATFNLASSTFNGYAMPLGPARNFNRVQFEIKPWSQQPITQVRVRVLDGASPTTAVALTDQTVSVQTQRGVAQVVTVDLPKVLSNPNADFLWLEWRCDGYTGFRPVSPTIRTEKGYYFYTTLDVSAATVPSQDSSVEHAYVRLSLVGDAPAQTSTWQAQVAAAARTPWLNLRSTLPAQLYAATGRELNLYFANFLRADVPLSTYSFVVTCAKGENDASRWFYTPIDADAGAVAWSVAVYWGATLVATFSTTINFVAAASGTGVTRKLLAVGDSLTSFGYYLAELKRLFTGDPMTLSIVGSLSTTIADSAGTSQTVAHDGTSGKDINWTYTNAASPFVFAGVFNFPTFLTTNSITMAATDTVLIMLGTNDVFFSVTDAATQLQVRTMLTQLAGIITSIKAAPTPPRIVLAMTPPPAASQDAFGVNYGSGQTRDRFARNVALWREALIQAYDGGAVAGVSLAATHLNLDTVNGFPTTATAFANRITATYAKQSNGIHPIPSGASGGFWQMADTIYSYLKATA